MASVTLTAQDRADGLRTDKQARFAMEYVKDYCGAQAAIRAGYAVASAKEIASELLTFPNVRAAVERRQEQLAAMEQVDGAMVIKELYDVATADPRDLMSVTIDCCRHCYGLDNLRQWTRGEYKRALNKALAADEPTPELEGGLGFDPRRPPVESCSECHGRGIQHVTVTPSAKLSRAAARLLASMKNTKEGVEIKTRDQDGAILALGKVVGLFRDRTELSGPGGAPLQMQTVAAVALTSLSNEELEAILRDKGMALPQPQPAPALEATNER
ncbi:MAG: BcepIL02 gp28 [Edaphobacter sp.]|nr:BcepIL02 gp28 [Edaphobacter sp.]